VTVASRAPRYGRRVDESFELEIPPDLEAGAYADRLYAWFSRHHFTLDFAAPSSDGALIGTARIRVPATAALDVLRSLEESVRTYELQYGEIHRPRHRGEE
jgi:hypothetical protein